MGRLLWAPSPGRVESTRLADFQRSVGVDGGYAELHEWSITNPEAFWSSAWDATGLRSATKGDRIFLPAEPWYRGRWFPEASLNVVDTLLRHEDDHPAIIFRAEDRVHREVSWAQLHALVSQLQQLLRSWGVGCDDRVGAWLPNLPESVAIMLATASLGATFSSCSPDFGVNGVVDRFAQVGPKVLFATDANLYGGQIHDCLDRLADIERRLPTVEHTVLVPYLSDGGTAAANRPLLADLLDEFAPAPVETAPLPFDHPWVILFSSGTTGVPKCIVHRSGGVLLKHLVEHQLHCDVNDRDRIFYFTTTGWMMWNWLVSGLGSGATIVLYDGSPFYPSGHALFELVEAQSASFFGTSAKFIDTVAKADLRPGTHHDLRGLRVIASTGSTLLPEGFESVYATWSADVHLASISGGTDLCGCLVAGDPTGPVYSGEIQRPALGMAIGVLDDSGQPCPPGLRGELVCQAPFPSIPLGFAGDDAGTRFAETYFERFPGCWHQGDFAEWTEHGGVVIHGRSDATLNSGGVRIGTAELYRPVEQFPEVVEALAIGQDWDGDTRIVLFVRMSEGLTLDDDLSERLRRAIRISASPRHVPARIVAVPDIPRTRSGKLVELAVREVVHGRPVKNLEALANPEALEFFLDLPELNH